MAFSIVSFLSIDAVGSELWTALHEYINGDTHKSVFDNSSPVSFPTASSTACCSRPFLTCGFEASSLACCLALALVLQREHIPDFPCASLSQLATPQREPPPCFPHRSVVPRARLPQPATLQRQPPPCFPHKSVVLRAMLPQPATSQRRRAFLCWDADDDDDDDIVQFVVSPGHLVLWVTFHHCAAGFRRGAPGFTVTADHVSHPFTLVLMFAVIRREPSSEA